MKVDTRIQTAPGRLTIGNRTIGDAHAYGMLTVEEVVAKSSNVGTAKIALDLPAQTLWETYTGVGFGQAPRIDFPGAVTGRCGRQRLGYRSSRRRFRTAMVSR